MSGRASVDAARALALLGDAARELGASADTSMLCGIVERALGELVGFRLFTVLRATPDRDGLERLHSSDPVSYPARGVKSVAGDAWLQRLLADPSPALSPDTEAVRRNFPDSEAIFGLGCASALNVPICFQGHILGSMNLLHEAHWFRADDTALCEPFAVLLGAAFFASSSPASSLSSSSSSGPATQPAGASL